MDDFENEILLKTRKKNEFQTQVTLNDLSSIQKTNATMLVSKTLYGPLTFKRGLTRWEQLKRYFGRVTFSFPMSA